MLLTFLLASALLAVLPGPDLVVVLRSAVRDRRAGLLCGLGAACGALVWGGVTAVGLAAVLRASAPAYQAVRLTGAAYLVILGVRAIVRRRHAAAPRVPALASGLLTDLFNPKTGALYVVLVPQLIPAGYPLARAVLLFAAVDAAVVAAWFTLVARLAGRIGRLASLRRAERAVGLLLIGLGLRTALDAL